jgi:DNA-binding transcriptional regulator LsrR (DeoR family)
MRRIQKAQHKNRYKALKAYNAEKLTVQEIASKYEVSRSTIYRWVNEEKAIVKMFGSPYIEQPISVIKTPAKLGNPTLDIQDFIPRFKK